MPFVIDRSSICESLHNEVDFLVLSFVQCPRWTGETPSFTGTLLLLSSHCDHGANLI
jgi:hypothetical protein